MIAAKLANIGLEEVVMKESKGTQPVLEVDYTVSITDSHAILQYLFDASPLLGKSDFEKAQVD